MRGRVTPSMMLIEAAEDEQARAESVQSEGERACRAAAAAAAATAAMPSCWGRLQLTRTTIGRIRREQGAMYV